MSNELTVHDDFGNLQRMALALYKSGYFKDAQNEAQAIVKVMAGAELGLPPFASMTNIHIISGKPVLGANLIATLIKNDPRYDYRVTTHNDDACEIEFFEGGQVVGVSSFSIGDSQKAGLGNNANWKKYPRNMLFARAISNGARWYTPGIFGGAAVYTPDELGVATDEDGDVVIEGEIVSQPVTRANGSIVTDGKGHYEEEPTFAEIEAEMKADMAHTEPDPTPAPDNLTELEQAVWDMAPQSFGGFVAASVDHFKHAAHVKNTMKLLKSAGELEAGLLKLDTPLARLTVFRALVAYAAAGEGEEE